MIGERVSRKKIVENISGDVIWLIFDFDDILKYLILSSEKKGRFTCNTQYTVDWISFKGSCGQ